MISLTVFDGIKSSWKFVPKSENGWNVWDFNCNYVFNGGTVSPVSYNKWEVQHTIKMVKKLPSKRKEN